MKSLSFFKGLSWLIILNLLVKPVWLFFIDREVQNIVGHEVYGRYFAVLSLSYVLIFLSDAGLSTMLNQRLAANNGSGNTRLLFSIKIFLLGLFVVACCFAGWLTGISQWNFLFYVICIQVFNSLFIFLRSIITAHQLFAADAWLSVIDKFLMTVFCAVLIYGTAFGSIDLVVFLQVQTACTALAVAIAAVYIWRRKLIRAGGEEASPDIVRTMVPFAAVVLLMGLHSRLDGFLLERMHHNGAYEAGLYASAFRLLDAGNMVGYLSASFLLPFIARHRGDKPALGAVILSTRHFLVMTATGVVCFTLFFATWIQQLLYHSSEPYHSSVIQVCVATLPAYYLIHIYGTVLTATRRFDIFLPILLGSAVVNIVLNLVLVPSYGAMGCCIAAISSQYLCGIACYFFASKSLGLSLHVGTLLQSLIVAFILCSLFYFGKTAINNVWIILAIAVVIVLFALSLQIRNFKKYFISLR